jgi:hypothetical protein
MHMTPTANTTKVSGTILTDPILIVATLNKGGKLSVLLVHISMAPFCISNDTAIVQSRTYARPEPRESREDIKRRSTTMPKINRMIVVKMIVGNMGSPTVLKSANPTNAPIIINSPWQNVTKPDALYIRLNPNPMTPYMLPVVNAPISS